MTMENEEQPPLAARRLAGFNAEPERTLAGVLGKAWMLYRQCGWDFTQVLLFPVSKIVLGLYGAIVLSQLFTQWMTQPAQASFTTDHLILVIIVLLGICGVCFFFFFQGAWQYLVYWVSLCRNVPEVLAGQTPDFKAAYAVVEGSKKAVYIQWLALLCLLPLAPIVTLAGLPAMGLLMAHAPASVFLVLLLLGVLVGGLLGLVWLVVQVLLSYVFQVLALEETLQGIEPVLWRSVTLTRQRPWLTLGLQVVLLILTAYILPILGSLLLRFARVASPLDDLHAWLFGTLLGNIADSIHQAGLWGVAGQGVSLLQAHYVAMAQGTTDAVVSAILSLFLLPLGTIAFTLVYLGLSQQEKPLSCFPEL
jgi:hypothetical protein